MRPHALAVPLMLLAAPALADRIDGEWCSALGAHINVDGSSMVTPGGNAVEGLYDRHAAAFTLPEGEEGAGADVVMRLLSEESALVQIGEGEAAEWRRCEVIS